ncbi:MAG: hypothetical protein A4S09_10090 [Proteobacteria bacterium SG_bin7]|nr:MAG: hypothetical protein A4S09_10090 [Proteobacteria bacterium SG_bin7]
MNRILFFYTFSFLVLANFCQAEVCGKILKIQGDVEILRIKETKDVRIGIKATDQAPLQCDDIILTGRASRAKLKLGSTVVTMSSQSRLAAEEHNEKTHEPNLLSLMYGKIRALVKPRETGEKNLQINTSTAVMGVRGTDLFVGFDPNTRLTHQATIEGKVEVEQKVTGQKIMVDPGQQIKIEAHIAPDGEEIQAPLRAEPISIKVVEQIRQASFIAKDDKEFATTEAVKILGEPTKWLPPDEELPLDLRGMKNEF